MAKPPIAVVGAGLVGAGWAIVFARAGHPVRIYDSQAGVRAKVLDGIRANARDLKSFDLIDDVDALMARITVHDDLGAAVDGVSYVQESVFESIPVKTPVYAALDTLVAKDVPIGSSSSGIPASQFTEGCKTRARMLIAHPVNPPYLVPLVELVPAPWTSPAAVDQVHALMTAVDQEPIRVNHEVEGFILNRLQGALLSEAWALAREGAASVADIDKTVSAGLGLRWAFMGPFETIDLNAPKGVADYAARLGKLFHGIAASRSNPQPWDAPLVTKVEKERREDLAADKIDDRRAWRDRRLMALAVHKAKAAKQFG